MTVLAMLAMAWFISSCATFGGYDQPKVSVVGLEPLPSEGLEMRFALKLRLQNPNDTAIDFDGIALEVDLDGKGLASGVSDTKGVIPRFGEQVVTIPVSVSAFAALRQLLTRVTPPRSAQPAAQTNGLRYSLSGKLGRGGGFNPVRFGASGELNLAPAGN